MSYFNEIKDLRNVKKNMRDLRDKKKNNTNNDQRKELSIKQKAETTARILNLYKHSIAFEKQTFKKTIPISTWAPNITNITNCDQKYNIVFMSLNYNFENRHFPFKQFKFVTDNNGNKKRVGCPALYMTILWQKKENKGEKKGEKKNKGKNKEKSNVNSYCLMKYSIMINWSNYGSLFDYTKNNKHSYSKEGVFKSTSFGITIVPHKIENINEIKNGFERSLKLNMFNANIDFISFSTKYVYNKILGMFNFLNDPSFPYNLEKIGQKIRVGNSFICNDLEVYVASKIYNTYIRNILVAFYMLKSRDNLLFNKENIELFDTWEEGEFKDEYIKVMDKETGMYKSFYIINDSTRDLYNLFSLE